MIPSQQAALPRRISKTDPAALPEPDASNIDRFAVSKLDPAAVPGGGSRQ
jgi:hypothetical protein